MAIVVLFGFIYFFYIFSRFSCNQLKKEGVKKTSALTCLDQSHIKSSNLKHPLTLTYSGIGGGLDEWFRALELEPGGAWFKSSTLMLPRLTFVLGSLSRWINNQLVSLPPVGILNSLCSI